ncbi:MAG: hypothetical protein LJF04_13915 [Gemmatimonadetes bacterium]|nr:hypothetical protein [Gemmatimonadota bacterium]
MSKAWAGAVALALVACASASGNRGSGAPPTGNVITAKQISKIEANNAAEIVERLHPNWLRGRGAASIAGGVDLPVVYIDDTRQGGIEQLGRISARIIQEIRFVPGTDASVRYGLGHGGGVILVVTRTPGVQDAAAPPALR